MDVVAAGDLAHRLAGVAPLDRLPPLVRGELRLAAKPHAVCLRSGSALGRADADQLALELGQPAQHGDDQPAVGGRRVGPRVAQGTEGGSLVGHGGQGVEQVAGGPGQAVEPRHHQHVAGGELVEHRTSLRRKGLSIDRSLRPALGGKEALQSSQSRRSNAWQQRIARLKTIGTSES